MKTIFERENRYIVIKVKDAEALPATDKRKLSEICQKVLAGRTLLGKPDLECVVVENDWPEYETVWAMIEARMAGQQLAEKTSADTITLSITEYEQLKKDAERYRFIKDNNLNDSQYEIMLFSGDLDNNVDAAMTSPGDAP